MWSETPPTDEHVETLLAAWLAFSERRVAGQPADELFWAWEEMLEYSLEAPHIAWPLVLRLLDAAKDPAVREQVAIGPLEILLDEHGQILIDEYEAEVKTNAHLRWGVDRMITEPDTEIWKRIYLAAGVDFSDFEDST